MKISLSVYPNPASVQVNIQTSGNEAIQQIEIYDVAGRKALIEKVNEPFKAISVAALPSGIYNVKVVVNGTTGVYKLVKQ